MAFNGNLHEFGIVALLQLPNTNRLSGRLLIHSEDREAEFFYTKGRLTHSACGETTGKEALSSVLDWDEGRFTFETDVQCTQESIKEDLHHTLMWALKERDERKKREEEMRLEEERRRREMAAMEPEPEEPQVESRPIPQELLAAAPHGSFACILNSSGDVTAATPAEEDYMADIQDYLQAVRSFVKEYPDGPMGKTFIDDSAFSMGLNGIEGGSAVVLFAAPNTRLGILSMELGKLTGVLEKAGFGETDAGRSTED